MNFTKTGRPVNNLWRCCQDVYAKRLGTKYLRDVKPRSDRGKHRKHISGMARTRSHLSKETATSGARTDVTENVFGYDLLITASKLKVIRKQEESKAFQELMVKLEQQLNKKREGTNKVLAAAPRSFSLCDLPAAKRRKVEHGHQRRQTIIEDFGFERLQEVSCRRFSRIAFCEATRLQEFW